MGLTGYIKDYSVVIKKSSCWPDYCNSSYSSSAKAASDVVQVVDAIQGWQREVLQNRSAE